MVCTLLESREESFTPTENKGASGDELAIITLQQPESHLLLFEPNFWQVNEVFL